LLEVAVIEEIGSVTIGLRAGIDGFRGLLQQGIEIGVGAFKAFRGVRR
jgi:hypothetical protein